MKRRRLLAVAGASAALHGTAAHAQRPVPRIGFLMAGDPEPMWTLFRKAMADHMAPFAVNAPPGA